MSSAWGKAWGSAWGKAWGAIGQVVSVVVPGSSGILRRRRWRPPAPRIARAAVTLDGATFTARGTSRPPVVAGRMETTLGGAVFSARGVVRAPVRSARIVATLDGTDLCMAAMHRPDYERMDEDAMALLLILA